LPYCWTSLRRWACPPFTEKEFLPLLAHAQSLPSGEAREQLLRHLDRSLTRLKRIRDLYDSNNLLSAQLKAEKPNVSEMNYLLSALPTWVKLLRTKFSEVADQEKAKGFNLWKSAWPWYEHELYCYTDAMLSQLQKIKQVPSKPEDTPQSPTT
jgi:hypothetical protein